MKTIHKFRLECGKEPNTLKLRKGYRVVRCEYAVPQKGVYLWVEQPLNVDIPVVEATTDSALATNQQVSPVLFRPAYQQAGSA